MATYLKGIGHYLPTKTLLNSDLEKMVDTSDAWIVERTGIKQRHIADTNETTTDLAYKASLHALEMAQVKAEDVQAIIFATTTPDSYLPQAACVLQRKLGATKAFGFDISAACSGFVYALSIADSMIRAQNLDNVLVVGAECLSRITDYNDRETCILFGDGAGVVLLGTRTVDVPTPFSTHLTSDGTLGDLLTLKNDRPNDPQWTEGTTEFSYIEMRGKEVFKSAVRSMAQNCQIALEKADLKVSDVDWLIPHQANKRIMDSVGDMLAINSERVATNIETTGNTSSASIPLVLSQYYQAGKIKRGQKILVTAFGGGLTSGAAVFEF